MDPKPSSSKDKDNDNGNDDFEGDDFATIRKKGIFVDAHIVCKGVSFGLHKLILAMYSEYFRRQFVKLDALASNSCVLQGKTSIVMENVEHIDVENVLSYMYDGEVRVQNENVDGFLEACKQLQLDGFQRLMEIGKGQKGKVKLQSSASVSMTHRPTKASLTEKKLPQKLRQSNNKLEFNTDLSSIRLSTTQLDNTIETTDSDWDSDSDFQSGLDSDSSSFSDLTSVGTGTRGNNNLDYAEADPDVEFQEKITSRKGIFGRMRRFRETAKVTN